MREAAFTHGFRPARKPRQSNDGVALERAYVYLRLDVWQALEAYMHRSGIPNVSRAITQLILASNTPMKADDDRQRKH
jgi:hypothetical protein